MCCALNAADGAARQCLCEGIALGVRLLCLSCVVVQAASLHVSLQCSYSLVGQLTRLFF